METFWDRVEKCGHKNLTDYNYFEGSCMTPYCGGINQVHCADCGVYISDCACLSNSGYDGWPEIRRRNWRKKQKLNNYGVVK